MNKGRYDWLSITLITWALYVLLAWLHCLSWIAIGIVYAFAVAILLKTRPFTDVLKFSFVYAIGLLILLGYLTLSWFAHLYDAFWHIHAIRVGMRVYRSIAMLIN
jgi:hypothetical protein